MIQNVCQYKEVLLNQISTNTWNPNTMDDERFFLLKKSLKERGGNLDFPILVRPKESGKYEIIDGEHRFKALLELGLKKAVCYIISYDDKTARLQTLIMDKLHGKFNNIKLGELCKDLVENFNVSLSEIEQVTGLEISKIEECMNILGAKFSEIEEDILMGGFSNDKDLSVPAEFEGALDFSVTEKQVELIKKALNKIRSQYPTETDGHLFTLIAQDFLKKKSELNLESIKEKAESFFKEPTDSAVSNYLTCDF